MGAFLLYQHLGGTDVGIDKVGAFFLGDGLDRQFELHYLSGVVDAENRMQEVYPEALGFTFFISLAGPFLNEGLCRLFLSIT